MLFGLKRKGIHVNSRSRNVGVVLVRLNKVEVRTKTLRETIVAVKLKLSTDDWVSASTLGSKTGVVSTSGSLVVIGKVDGSVVVGSSTATGGKVGPSNFGSSLFLSGLGANTSVGVVVNSGEGNGGITGLNVGTKGGLRVKETVGADNTEGIVVEIISVVVPLVHTELNDGVSLNDPDQFLDGVVKVQFDLDILAGN
jgi:hypothetical protein